ncbi:MAG: hypothetical protein R8K48_01030 [Gallionella sp.]
MRDPIIANATTLNHATRLGSVFHAVIARALDEVKTQFGDRLSQVIARIERHIENFFVQALQLAVRTMQLEAK